MEEFVISDLVGLEFVQSAAILDRQGFFIISSPKDEKTKQKMSKLAEILYASNDFDKTSIITENRIIMIKRLVKHYTLVIECPTNSNLGRIRSEISSAASRLDNYFSTTSR